MNPWWGVCVFQGLEGKIFLETIRPIAAGPIYFRYYLPPREVLPFALFMDVADAHVLMISALFAADIEDIGVPPFDTKSYSRAVATPGDAYSVVFVACADAHCAVAWRTWSTQCFERSHMSPRSKATIIRTNVDSELLSVTVR